MTRSEDRGEGGATLAQGVGCRGWGRELWKGRLRKAAVAVNIIILCRVRVVGKEKE